MAPRDIVVRRLQNLGLSASATGSPSEIVSRLVAVQSQDYGPAKWAVGQRTEDLIDHNVEAAFDEGSILRTHVLRPTWHLVTAEDIGWMLALTGPRVHVVNAHYYRKLELDAPVLDRTTKLIAQALEGGNSLTRKDLRAVLAKGGVEADSLRLGYTTMWAELEGVICSGPRRGKQQTYALLEERAMSTRSLDPDEALAELTLRYFTSHGPATIKDLKWWSSLTIAEIKRGLEMVGSQLLREEVDGLAFWSDPTIEYPKVSTPAVHLLQGYDEYIVGYSESKFLLSPRGGGPNLPPGTSFFIGAVMIDGKVAGHWKRTTKKDGLIVEVALYQASNQAEDDALQREVERMGRFVGSKAKLVTSVMR